MNDKLRAFLSAEKDSLAHGDSEKDHGGVILCAQDESVPKRIVHTFDDGLKMELPANLQHMEPKAVRHAVLGGFNTKGRMTGEVVMVKIILIILFRAMFP